MKKITLIILLTLLRFSSFSQTGFTNYLVDSMSSSGRTSIAIDLSGNKWYGSTSKGAFKFDGASWTIYNMITSSIPSNVIRDVTFDALGNGWFATNAGLAKFDGTTWTTFNVSNSGLANDTTYCVFAESSNIWIGTKKGLTKFNGSTWTVYNTSNSGIRDNYVTCLNIDTDGSLLVGTNTGFCIKNSASWINYTDENSNLENVKINDIYVENATTKWIGTNIGLFKLKSGTITPMSSLLEEKAGAYLSVINTISKGPQGGVLVNGTYGISTIVAGFFEIIDNELFFYQFPTGYISNFHVLESTTNKVWFVKTIGAWTTNNIMCFDYSSYTGTIVVPERTDTKWLDINQVKASIMNQGDMHRNLLAGAGYEVPKNSGRNAIFTSSLWIGGVDGGGSLHQAAMTYRQTGIDFWPGPLDTISGSIDSVTSMAYDSIWKLDRWQIDEFRTMFANGSVAAGTYIPNENIIHWPAHGWGDYTRNIAPFVDVNGDGLYNPLIDGDYPKIKGDQMCYWIFNDNLHAHTETGGAPLKVEIHASAYAYSCDNINDSLKALNYTTFYDYEIYNRSNNDYHDVYLSLWQDADLGGYNDDYVGCNSTENYSFVYNGDTVDEGASGVLAYGSKPPMFSNVVLNGPLAEPNDSIDNNNNGIIDEPGEINLMTNVLNYNNSSDPVWGNPNSPSDFYNYMHSKWKDGTHTTYGGNGLGGTTPYNFMFDGPLDGTPWSEISENNPFIDRKIVMSCGPFNLNVAQHVNFNFAIVFTRDMNPTYSVVNLYNQNLDDIRKIRQWYSVDSFPSCDPVSTGIVNHSVAAEALTLYPNPSSNTIYVDYNFSNKNATIEIYNITGQLVKSVKANPSNKLQINVSDIVSGLYILKIQDGNHIATKKFLKN